MYDSKKISEIFEKEPQLIELRNDKNTVFVGDTHGDIEASQKIIGKYPLEENRIVFLGDYVDRGPDSKGNINYLLKMKQEYPKNLILLLGNHDYNECIPCNPSDFWDSLNKKEKKDYEALFSEFPLAVSIDGIIALHGALPNIEKINEINKISKIENKFDYLISFIDKNKKYDWIESILWGDFSEKRGYTLSEIGKGRAKFGKDHFDKVMEKIGKNVLIRGHQSNASEEMYDFRCLTLFTSCAYSRPRRIAILEKGKSAKSINDLEIKSI